MQAFDHVSGQVLEIDGAGIYYEEHGDPDGPPLLMLHGGLGSLHDFAAIMPWLREGLRVVGIDNRGHGRSSLGDRPLDYARLQRDAQAVIEHLGLRRPALLGFSDGGIVAYRLAADPAPGIARVVAIGAHWEMPPGDPTRELLSMVGAERWRSLFPDSHRRYRQLNPTPDFDALVRAVRGMWLDEGDGGYPGEAVDRIACSLLLVRGEDDHLLSRESVARLASRVPRARTAHIAHAGHAAHEDQPEAVMRAVNPFLAP
jgi:pimeloyl-ACP methyl ester carboxylesterase